MKMDCVLLTGDHVDDDMLVNDDDKGHNIQKRSDFALLNFFHSRA